MLWDQACYIITLMRKKYCQYGAKYGIFFKMFRRYNLFLKESLNKLGGYQYFYIG